MRYCSLSYGTMLEEKLDLYNKLLEQDPRRPRCSHNSDILIRQHMGRDKKTASSYITIFP